MGRAGRVWQSVVEPGILAVVIMVQWIREEPRMEVHPNTPGNCRLPTRVTHPIMVVMVLHSLARAIRCPRELVHLAACAVLATGMTEGAEPVPPALFHLSDPGLEVTVWAKSPRIFNPTNIDIDARGRIWVAEGVNYRKHFDRRPEGDRIMVLEDTDGDGTADKSWPFVQEAFLRAPMGVAVIGNKVVVSMAPDLLVFTDVDGDARFDPAKGDTREVLLTGFNGRNHDHSLHSVTVGPDGKWYFSVGNCGAVFTDRDGRTWRIGASSQDSSWWPKDPAMADRDPKTFGGQKSDDGRVYVGGFIARMNPDGTGVEILAHNLRNSYENCVTSLGDIFASDNDDQPACRTFAVLEGGNYGFASRDGSRSWQADRRPGQDIKTATWRQQDPGVAPAGDIYGGGAPTGIVYYENGALGPQHQGTLLLCESARNTIFGYRPKLENGEWKLVRFDFLTTNKEGKVIGTDYTGGERTAKAEDIKTLFRPSDIAVGPDGAVYISDWFDPRTGGHNDLDDSLSGTIYRVAPKGFKSVVPAHDTRTVEGAVEALKSPAVHVRALGAEALRRHDGAWDRMMQMWREQQPGWARAAWLIGDPAAGEAFLKAVNNDPPRSSEADASEWSRLANRRLARLARDRGATDRATWSQIFVNRAPTSLFEGFLVFRPELFESESGGVFTSWADKLALRPWWREAWGQASRGIEDEVYRQILTKFGHSDPLQWSDEFAMIAWRLHPPESVPAFKTRGLSNALPEKARRDALTAIAFNDTKEAADAMLEVAVATKPANNVTPAAPGTQAAPAQLVHDTALWWLLNKKDHAWKPHGVAAALKEKSLYDPEAVKLVAISLPDSPPATFTVDEVLNLSGDAARGAIASQRCLMCHRIGENGVDFGPEMTGWGKTQPAQVVARALIDPSADIAHGFYGTRIETTDGLTIDGLVINDADPVIIQSMGGQTQTVPKSRIKAKRPLDRSLMMTAAALGLTAQDVADIVAFLKE
jgi:putative membrane-bound dehydrogenase-like protein